MLATPCTAHTSSQLRAAFHGAGRWWLPSTCCHTVCTAEAAAGDHVGIHLGGCFVQARDVLDLAQLPVGPRRCGAHARGQQPGCLGALQQVDVAGVGTQGGVRVGVGKHQVLHHEFHIDHAAGAVLHVEQRAAHRVGGAHLLAHGHDLGGQGLGVALGRDHGFSHRVEALLQFAGRGAPTTSRCRRPG
jgi:hypothetical protein